MNIDNCRLFLKAVRLGSLTAAAEQSGYTQSALSHIISGMEKEFGFPLFARSKAGVSLTQDGERLLPYITDAVNRMDILYEKAQEIKGLKSGKVRIGAFSSIAITRLPGIIRQFKAIHPNIDIDLRVDTYRVIEEWLVEGEVDCGFLSESAAGDMVFTPLAEDSMLALLPKEHPLYNAPALPIAEIAGIDFIVPGEGTNYDIGRIFRDAGISPNVRFAVSDDYAAAAMVRQGLGMTILPRLIIESIGETGRTLELEPAKKRVIGLAVRHSTAISPACRAFMDFAEAALRTIIPPAPAE